MNYLGDFPEDQVLYFPWHSSGADGASITRATNGTVSVYKDDGTTQTTAGITDTEDFDSLTGVHMVKIDLSADAFYAVAHDYSVVLSAATIDGQTVNAVLATFSIENRYPAPAALADTILQRPTSSVESGWSPGDRTLYGMIAALMHRHERDAGDNNIILYQSDDSTVLVTIPITKGAALEPIKKMDPPA